MTTPEFYFILRFDKDGNELGTVDIPARDLEATMRHNPTWKVVGETSSFVAPTLTPLQTPEGKPAKIACPLCPQEFSTEAGLKIHKSRAHK